MFRISLKKLLICVFLAATLFADATRIGMGTAEFEILENELELNNESDPDYEKLVSGRIWGSFVGRDSRGPWSRLISYIKPAKLDELNREFLFERRFVSWPDLQELSFVCEVRNIDRPSIVEIQPGQKNEVRYRVTEFWPLKKQDPFQIYLNRYFGISGDQIEGYVWTKAGARVLIDGTE